MTILLIDGRSGSGKTELARAIVALRPEVQLVRLDDLYPGWGGLEAGSRYVREVLLATGRWQRWDWSRSERAEWHEVDLSGHLVIEVVPDRAFGIVEREDEFSTRATRWRF